MELASASCCLGQGQTVFVDLRTSVLSHGVVWVWHGPSVGRSNTGRKGASPARSQAPGCGQWRAHAGYTSEEILSFYLSLNYHVLLERVTLSKSFNVQGCNET